MYRNTHTECWNASWRQIKHYCCYTGGADASHSSKNRRTPLIDHKKKLPPAVVVLPMLTNRGNGYTEAASSSAKRTTTEKSGRGNNLDKERFTCNGVMPHPSKQGVHNTLYVIRLVNTMLERERASIQTCAYHFIYELSWLQKLLSLSLSLSIASFSAYDPRASPTILFLK